MRCITDANTGLRCVELWARLRNAAEAHARILLTRMEGRFPIGTAGRAEQRGDERSCRGGVLRSSSDTGASSLGWRQ